jgi:1,4-dihydroxy-2-naphthoate octaprenyltransferase
VSETIGDSATGEAPSTLRIWFHAIRPRTLPAAIAAVVVGIGAALATGAPFRPDTAAGCLAVALLLQVLSNLSNDLSDFRRGADTPDRVGPTRVAAAGLVSERALERAIALTIVLAGSVGLWLVWVGGPVLLALGLLAVLAALAYTGGPWPYGYRGLGELFVFVFFGLVAVVGTAYLQAGRLDPLFWAAAVPPGALITAILVVNNLRDIPTDAAAGKRTLAVAFGADFARAEWLGLVLLAYLVPPILLASGYGLGMLWPALGAYEVGRLWRTIRSFGDPRELNAVLAGTARLALLFGLLFALGLAMHGLQPA